MIISSIHVFVACMLCKQRPCYIRTCTHGTMCYCILCPHAGRKSIQRSTTVGEDDQRGSAHPLLGATRPHSVDLYTADISDESISLLQKELEIEERIIEAARRLADIPCSKREKQRRKQSLQE